MPTQTKEIVPVDQLEPKSTDFLDQARQIRVKSRPTYDAAAQLVIAGKKLINTIKASYKAIKDKQNEALKETRRQENAQLEKPEKAVEWLQGQMTKWDTEQRIKAAEKTRAAEAEMEEKYPNAEIRPPVPVSEPHKAEGISYTDHWKFRINDKKAFVGWLIAHAPQFLGVDTVGFGKYVRAMKGEIKADGVTIYNERSQNVRTK